MCRRLRTRLDMLNQFSGVQSLMNFILPEQFAEGIDSLRAVFKTKGDSKITLLAQERVSRAKKMMTPFVLRRRKDQVCVMKCIRMRHDLIALYRYFRICQRRLSVLSGAICLRCRRKYTAMHCGVPERPFLMLKKMQRRGYPLITRSLPKRRPRRIIGRRTKCTWRTARMF